MQLGIIGLPAAGKTTIFNALTGSHIRTGPEAGSGRLEIHAATVDVPDPRVDQLSAQFTPRKTTYAKVTFADVGGLQAQRGAGAVPPALLNQLQAMDAFLLVLRAFENPQVPHPAGSVDPARDLDAMRAELLLNDMLVVERNLERLEEMRQKGGGDRAQIDRDIRLLKRSQEALSQETPLRAVEHTAEEARALSGRGLLTGKKLLAVVNLSEGQDPPELEVDDPSMQILPLFGELEMEIAELDEAERQVFLEEYGLQISGRARILQACYRLLDRHTFFTLNEQELRAWTLPRGATAYEAAGTVHSDMARGFIRAEVLTWEELLQLGGLAEARAQGRIRLEGKDSPVADGDVIYIRFNV